ncbi:hypothetical protein MNBD_ALPHA01-2406 [hydrothermal vent metagenome]|uniref:Flagellar protein FliL n=1 Tax=hydrothermal vent metagenome TaxID=652676 RepID=A0A3B0SUQ5_9ZZZZ
MKQIIIRKITRYIFRNFFPAIAAVLLYIPAAIAISAPATASEEKADAKEADNGELTKENYIAVPPIVATMYHKGRPKGNITVTLLIKLTDSEKRATAKKYLPRLNSAFVMEANRLSHDYFDIRRPVNVAMIGDAFQLVTNRTLGHKQARVLISDVVVNKR